MENISKQASMLHEALDRSGIEFTYLEDDSYYGARTSWVRDNGVRVSYLERGNGIVGGDTIVVSMDDLTAELGIDKVTELIGLR